MNILEIEKLNVNISDKNILKNIDLKIPKGELHVLLGTNGSGKSTLLNAIMGNPVYEITGSIKYAGEKINNLSVDERAKKGIFLSFQNPEEIDGIKLHEFLRFAKTKITDKKQSVMEFGMELSKNARSVGMSAGLQNRYLNSGFSGGEKKKSEILQIKMLDPNLIMLDEIDSGLDIDATRIIYKQIDEYINNPEKTILLVSHNIFNIKDLPIDKVHVLHNGKIVLTGKKDLISKIEKKGFEWINEN